ncbi:MAG: branched-chain amino acid ABC transporter permease, partial [Pseudomonadota bacterium]
MRAKPVFLGYSVGDIIGFIVIMAIGFAAVPMLVQSDYWYASILIPWLCLALAAIGQQIVMGYAGQLAVGAAGFMAAGAFACYN